MTGRLKYILGVLTVTFTAFSNHAWAQDWSQWRGANRDGKASALMVGQKWPESLSKKWTTEVGLGDATPACAGDHLYTFGRMDTLEVVQCLNLSDGSVIWKDSYPAGLVVGGPARSHPGPRGSVAVAGGKVYTLGVGGILTCLDAATGKVNWRKASIEDYQGTEYKFGTSMSVLLARGLCVAHIGKKGQGAIMAFDATSGQREWILDDHGASCSSPILMTVGGVAQVVILTDKNLLGLSLSDGKLLWQTPFEAEGDNIATPVQYGNQLIMTGRGIGMVIYEVQQDGGDLSVSKVWDNPSAQLASRFTTPVINGDLLMGYTRQLFCLNLNTKAVLWEAPGTLGNSAALVHAGPVMVAQGLNGTLVVYEPDVEQYVELAQYTVGEPECWAHPVINDNQFIIRDRDSVTLWNIL